MPGHQLKCTIIGPPKTVAFNNKIDAAVTKIVKDIMDEFPYEPLPEEMDSLADGVGSVIRDYVVGQTKSEPEYPRYDPSRLS